MSTRKSNSIQSQPDFAEFWEHFELLPWKWADVITSNPAYLVGSALYGYIVLAALTYFPNNPWIAPTTIGYPSLIQFVGSDKYLPLKIYPSLHFFLVGWILVVILMIRWRHTIPQFFQWLLNSQRLRVQKGNLAEEYRQYLQDYQHELGKRNIPLLLSALIVMLFIALLQRFEAIPFIFDHYTPAAAALLIAGMLIALFWVFMVGQFSWALYVTARFIGDLTRRFDLDIQASHPDKCGGLKPIGDFCLGAAVPLIVGGMALVAVSILHLDYFRSLSVMATTFIFVAVAPLTALTVFMPIWNIHIKMAEHMKAYADEFQEQILLLEKNIFANTREEGDLNKARAAKEKRDILQSLHPDQLDYPLWPFRFTRTVLTIFSPQLLVTMVGIVTTIYSTFFKK